RVTLEHDVGREAVGMEVPAPQVGRVDPCNEVGIRATVLRMHGAQYEPVGPDLYTARVAIRRSVHCPYLECVAAQCLARPGRCNPLVSSRLPSTQRPCTAPA